MKGKIKYIFILLLGFHFLSCEGDLNPQLYGTITNEDAFKTPQDLEAATTALYYELRQKGWGPYLFTDGSSFVMDVAVTDEWTTKWAWTNFLNGTWTTQEAMAIRFYDWTAPNITRCTYTIARIEECALSDEVKNEYISQIKALRAFFMFDLYRFYGPMPMIIEAERAINPDPDYRPERPSAESVEEFIRTELRTAADMLPVEWSQYGRITKGAALHYLLKYHMFKKEWQEALNIANEIIGLNYYRLEENYADIFSAQNEGNRELIFVIRAEALADYGNHTYANILPGDFASPHGNVVDGWNGHRMPWDFYDTFDENDKRRELAVVEYRTKSGSITNLRETGDIGALPLKYGIDPEASGIWAGNDKVMDRYAEVLLFKAEALNELNGPNEQSINLINDIRKRAFGAGVSIPSEIILKEEFDTEINGNAAGFFTMNNYDENNGAAWTYAIDNTSVLSGENSLHINVIRSNNEFWALQVRADNQPVKKDRTYSVRFNVKSSQNMNLDFRSEGPLSHTEIIPLTAGEVKNVSFDTTSAGEDGNCVIFFALGNTGNNYDIWIDDIVFEAKEQVTGGVGDFLIKLSDFPDKESLRDWILKERGWEFWYEGKRRPDLIRMNKYIEVGQQVGNNFGEKNLLFPLPSHVLIENPRIKQNPGY
ncbi:RagB/SusD family nutrient uptake outer membrane protein [Proteiniphilum sp. X52]|uniref:RagB/SusD family nutrient uptake outer membrane protein n=1 Tax=Proteiniphilum sp. X52 TaxID=2382159 RepID=UPI000F0A3A8C|nr:RagB/SusD family nutrient uptake outer membrane protein [Proteiniphilum sp. X52]RNC66721.1 RagB/SusD family nutrient uptake outer membrane protein [Proteiniphilum sp. X52]